MDRHVDRVYVDRVYVDRVHVDRVHVDRHVDRVCKRWFDAFLPSPHV